MGYLSDFVVGLRRIPTGMAFSLFSKSSTPSSPDVKPGQPKEAEGPSLAKGSFSGLAFFEIPLLITNAQTRPNLKAHRQVHPGQRSQKRSPHPQQTSLNPLLLPLAVRGVNLFSFMQGRMISAHLLLTPCSLQNQKRKAKVSRPQSLLLLRTPRNLSRHRRRATYCQGLHLPPSPLTPALMRLAKKPLPQAPLSKAIQLRNQIRDLILKKSGNQSPRRRREDQLILTLARLNANRSLSVGGH